MKRISIWTVFALLLWLGPSCGLSDKGNDTPLNILLITLDDMGYGTTGVEGSTVENITPNIDRLASQGMLITHGFVMSPICGPSRNALLSGRYPHCSGSMGHGEQPPGDWQAPEVITPILSQYLHDKGYATGAILKNRRLLRNVFDVEYHERPFGVGHDDRSTESFFNRSLEFIQKTRSEGKPFFLYANPIDPHRPWVNTEQERTMLEQWNPDNPYPDPPMKYSPESIEVPNFLPDLLEVRERLVPYYESLCRGDACIGAILRALEESGESENTLVIFLSDHGMGAPGAKLSLHHAGLRTPVIVRWPGHVEEGVVNTEAVVSSIDITPTIIQATGLPEIEGIEGMSFLDLVLGMNPDRERQYAYAASNYYNQSIPENFFPHRAIIDREYCYIWNSYVIRFKGEKKFSRGYFDVIETCFNEDYPEVFRKYSVFLDRPVEELYDLAKDPGCWHNLAGKQEYRETLNMYRERLLSEMKSTSDPELFLFTSK